jgi:hypothetical protein
MPSTGNDRFDGITTSTAVKAPCKAVSTTALTLNGEQTVGGVACVTGDRVLQAVAAGSVNNGIWIVSTGAWSRATDFDGNRDVRKGTLIVVASGDAAFYRVTTSDPIVIGTTAIAIAALSTNDAASVTFTQAGAGAVERTVQSKLRERVSVLDFGAVGDGDSASAGANSVAFAAAIAALSIGTQYGVARRRALYIPAGVYYLDANLSFLETGFGGGWTVEGDGDLNTILLFTTTSGDAVTVQGNFFQFRDLSIYGTAARQAGSGRGLVVDANLSSTSYRGEFTNIRIYGHAGDGFYGERIEHHHFKNFLVQEVGGRGFVLDSVTSNAAWNLIENLRTQETDGDGIVLGTLTAHNTLINPEAIEFGRTDTAAVGIRVSGRGNILDNADAENIGNVTVGTTYIGIRLAGTRHRIRGGYVGDVNTAIALVSADQCEIDDPTITNGTSGVAAADAITTDAGSTNNRFVLPSSVTNFTNVLTPANGRAGDIINQVDGVFGRTSSWTAGIEFGGAAVGLTIASQSCRYTSIGKLVYIEFDITLSAKGSSTGAAKVTGLPFTSASDSRGMLSVQIVSNGSGASNLDASGVSPGTLIIDLRSQGATGFSELTDANFTGTTRIIGSGHYLAA